MADYVPNQVPTPPQPGKSGSSTGLWIALGAISVLVVLAAAGLVLPRMLKTLAKEKQPAVTETAAPAPATTPAAATAPAADNSAAAPTPSPDAAASATPADAPAPVASTAPNPALAPNKSARVGKGSAVDAQQAATEAAQHAADERALHQLAEESHLLSTRMAASDASLETMKQAQAQSGYGLRGDIASAQQRVHANMQRLDAAIQNHDLKAAQKYMALCDEDAATIDKFLGH